MQETREKNIWKFLGIHLVKSREPKTTCDAITNAEIWLETFGPLLTPSGV